MTEPCPIRCVPDIWRHMPAGGVAPKPSSGGESAHAAITPMLPYCGRPKLFRFVF